VKCGVLRLLFRKVGENQGVKAQLPVMALKFLAHHPKTTSTSPLWTRRPEGVSNGAPVMVPAAMLALRSAFRRILRTLFLE